MKRYPRVRRCQTISSCQTMSDDILVSDDVKRYPRVRRCETISSCQTMSDDIIVSDDVRNTKDVLSRLCPSALSCHMHHHFTPQLRETDPLLREKCVQTYGTDHCLSANVCVPLKCLWSAGEVSEDVPQAASSVAPKVAGFPACAKHRVG